MKISKKQRKMLQVPRKLSKLLMKLRKLLKVTNDCLPTRPTI